MKALFAIALVPLLLLCSCTAPGIRRFELARQPKEAIRFEPIDVAAFERQHPGEEGVYLHREYILEHVPHFHQSDKIDGLWDVYRISADRYLVLKPDVEWLGTFNLTVSKHEKLEKVHITLLAPDGTIRVFDKGDLRRSVDADGDHVYKLAYPGIVKGSIVDVGYETSFDANVYHKTHHFIPLYASMPAERMVVRYVLPDDWKLAYRQGDSATIEGMEGFTVRIDTLHEQRVIAYDRTKIPAVEDEPYSPYLKEFAPFIEVAIMQIETRGGFVDNGPQNWEEYAGQFRYLIPEKEKLPRSGRMRDTVKKITAGEPTPYAKMRRIVSWVQKNIAIDWNSSSLATFNDLMKRKRGTPYQISAMTRAMLEMADIPSLFLLIHTAQDGPFNPDYTFSGSLYVTGLSATIDSTVYYLFPYIPSYPVNLVPPYLQGQPALQVGADGYLGFDTIPPITRELNKVTSHFDATIDEEGNVTVTEVRTISGDDSYWLRRDLVGLDEEAMRKEVKDLITFEEGEITLVDYELTNLQEYDMPLIVEMTYTVDNIVTITPGEVIVQSQSLFAPALRNKWKFDVANRRNPVKIYSEELIEKEIVIHLPENWQLQKLPADVDERNLFGEVTGTHRFEAGRFDAHHRRVVLRTARSATMIDRLVDIIGIRSKVNHPTLVFTIN